MNFGPVSPSGLGLLSPSPTTTTRRRKSTGKGFQFDITHLLDLSNPKRAGAGLLDNFYTSKPSNANKTPRNLVLDLDAFEIQNHGHGHSFEKKRVFGSVEDINQNYNRNSVNDKSPNYGSNSTLNISKSRVPDIQMINKYYGLIPKKFTVHSRNSGDDKDRNLKSGSRFRAKSAITSKSRTKAPTKNSSLDEPSGSGSDTEYIQPRSRRGTNKSANSSSPSGNDSKLQVGTNVDLLTRKMSVEKQKKLLKHRGRSSSLPLSETHYQNQNRHASPVSTLSRESQRVIRIDLSNMSWEETCQSSSPSDEPDFSSTCSSPTNNNANGDIRENNRYEHYGESSVNDEGNRGDGSSSNYYAVDSLPQNCEYVHNSGESVTTFSSTTNTTTTSPNASVDISFDPCGTMDIGSGGESNTNHNHAHLAPPLGTEFAHQVVQVDDGGSYVQIDRVHINRPDSIGGSVDNTEDIKNGVNQGNENLVGERCQVPCSVVGERREEMGDKSGTAGGICGGSRRGTLKKTISFDEQLLRHGDGGHRGKKLEPESSKPRRPTTASIKHSISTWNLNTTTTNQKVLPWTQKAGKGMTWAERRSKFQKSVSIQSSVNSNSTQSFDFDEGECSDSELDHLLRNSTSTTSTPSPNPMVIPALNSSAYKEIRKGLFFHPAPEVPTLVSLISPIETLEIQYEIEKVAVMLHNMQNQNKSFIDLTPDGAHFQIHTKPPTPTRDNEFPKDTRGANTEDFNGNRVSICTTDLSVDTTPNANLTCPSGNLAISDSLLEKGLKEGEDKGWENNGTFQTTTEAEMAANLDCNRNSNTAINLEKEALGKNLSHHSHNGLGHVDSSNSDSSSQSDPTGRQQSSYSNPNISLVTSTNLKSLSTPNTIVENGVICKKSSTMEVCNPTTGDQSMSCPATGTGGGGPISTKVQNNSPNLPVTPPSRPVLKKAISISCEKEVLGTSGCQNGVNGNGNRSSSTATGTSNSNNGNKSPRPKTAVTISSNTSKTLSRTSSTPSIHSERTRSPVSNHNRLNQSRTPLGKPHSPTPNHRNNATDVLTENSQNSASKNRKILIKKALLEINQSSVNLGKKFGVLGRPKTAPSPSPNSSKKAGIQSFQSQPCGQNQKRQPLKASQSLAPAPTPTTWTKAGQTVGTKVITSSAMGRKSTEKGRESQTLISTVGEQKEETKDSNSDSSPNPNSGRRGLPRQSFSLDEGMLLGFSNKEFGWNSKSNSVDEVDEKVNSLVQSSKKREECLKIYEKMVKTGLAVKLDTIFRGMMTPSEYRAFIKAAENAAREAAEAEEERKLNEMADDAGVKPKAVSQEECVN